MSWLGTHPTLPKSVVPDIGLCKRCKYLFRLPKLHKHFDRTDNCSRCGIPGKVVFHEKEHINARHE